MTAASGITLTSVAVYPVKSTARRELRSARVQPSGLPDDRSWMVVDRSGEMVSAREAPALLQVRADTAATDPAVPGGLLRLHGADLPDLLLPTPQAARVPVRLFGSWLEGVPVGDDADDWLGRLLRRDDVRLVWCDDPTRRRLDPAHTGPDDHTAFADGYPVTLASESSLQQVAEWVTATGLAGGEPDPPRIGQDRFRANLVVSGSAPFAEDAWSCVQVGAVRLRKAKDISRCMITTIDPDTLVRGREPLGTLARHRRTGKGSGVRFGIHLVPETTGTITVGDEVTILR